MLYSIVLLAMLTNTIYCMFHLHFRDNVKLLSIIEEQRKPYLFTSAQLESLVLSTTSLRTRLEIIRMIGPRLVDPYAKKDSLMAMFRFVNDKDIVEDVLKQRSNLLSITQFKASSGSSLLRNYKRANTINHSNSALSRPVVTEQTKGFNSSSAVKTNLYNRIDASIIPTNSQIDVSTIPTNSHIDVSTIPTNSHIDTSTIPTNSHIDVSTIPTNSHIDTSTIPTNSHIDTSTIPTNSHIDVSTILTNSHIDVSTIPTNSHIDVSTIPTNSHIDVSSIPTNSHIDVSSIKAKSDPISPPTSHDDEVIPRKKIRSQRPEAVRLTIEMIQKRVGVEISPHDDDEPINPRPHDMQDINPLPHDNDEPISLPPPDDDDAPVKPLPPHDDEVIPRKKIRSQRPEAVRLTMDMIQRRVDDDMQEITSLQHARDDLTKLLREEQLKASMLQQRMDEMQSEHELVVAGLMREKASLQEVIEELRAQAIVQELSDTVTHLRATIQQLSLAVVSNITVPDTKKGYLWKEGRNFKNWKRRFVVLEAGVLTYYVESTTDYPYGIDKKGELSLKSVTMSIDGTKIKLSHICSGSNKDFNIEIKSSEERDEWSSALQAHIDYCLALQNI